MATRFVGLGENGRKIFLYEADRTTEARQVLWGDFLNVQGEEPDGFLRVTWGFAGPNPRDLFIPKEHTIETRPLEVIFVDVGQGDGAVLITPERGSLERIVVIDAGERRNMLNFLNARFKTSRARFQFDAAVLTHPDRDHYLGFRSLFENHNIGFDTVYQNGLVERPVAGTWAKVGGLTTDPASGDRFVIDLAQDRADIARHFADSTTFGQKVFPPVMHAALKNPNVGDFQMLSTQHGTITQGATYMPGFAPADPGDYTIEVLGPVVETVGGGPALRKIGDYGETKNGHSILLKLQYGNFTLLFGGDLNHKAEKFLLQRYAGIDRWPSAGSQEYQNMVTAAANHFRAHVMKVCHHGSEKVTDAFLETVNPACFIISSGDQEGHVHPRPDLLGRLGRFGRGDAPVLLSTELQRSTREREDRKTVDRLRRDIDDLAANPSDALRNSIQEQLRDVTRRNVEVYGAIYVKTDGQRLITAFRIETGSQTDKWFYFEYEVSPTGELLLVG